MRLHSLTIVEHKSHKQFSNFYLERFWRVNSIPNLADVIKILKNRTILDQVGRVLCIGEPRAYRLDQQRLYVVKWGHDDKLFAQTTPLLKTVVNNLKSSARTP